jgi:tetratricopeptide (TPR) repeat protein
MNTTYKLAKRPLWSIIRAAALVAALGCMMALQPSCTPDNVDEPDETDDLTEGSVDMDKGTVLGIASKQKKALLDRFSGDDKAYMNDLLNHYSYFASQLGTTTRADAHADNPDLKRMYALMVTTQLSLAQVGEVSGDILTALACSTLEAFPEHPLVVNNAAAALFGVGQEADALILFKEAVAAAPKDPIALTNLAEVCLTLGAWADAETYARQALDADNEYGPAWQTLTTVYLHDKAYEIAAETMFRSARYCWNETSEWQFGSFLTQIENMKGDLDEGENEYPNEYPVRLEIIELLYSAVEKDCRVIYSEEDTPKGQLTLKPINLPGSSDLLVRAYKDLNNQFSQLINHSMALISKRSQYANAESKLKYHLEKGRPGRSLEKMLARQYYAFCVLSSYYSFMREKAAAEFKQKEKEWQDAYDKEKERIDDNYEREIKAAEERMKNAGSPTAVAAALEEIMKLIYEWEDDIVQLNGEEYPKWKTLFDAHYRVIKQNLEECWLKTGGILAYVGDEELFEFLKADRELDINSAVADIVGLCSGMSGRFYAGVTLREMYAKLFNIASLYDSDPITMPPMRPEPVPPLKTFEHPDNHAADWTVSLTCYALGVTVKREGDPPTYGYTFTTPFSIAKFSGNTFNGSYTTITATGVPPEVTAGIAALKLALGGEAKFNQMKEGSLKDFFFRSTPEGTLPVGFHGEFITRDKDHNIVSRGEYTHKSLSLTGTVSNPNLMGYGLSGGTTLTKETFRSLQTGVKQTSSSVKTGLGFDFKATKKD